MCAWVCVQAPPIHPGLAHPGHCFLTPPASFLYKTHIVFSLLQTWKEPRESAAAMAAVCLLCFLPRLAVPALLAWLVCATLAAQPDDAGEMHHMLPVAGRGGGTAWDVMPRSPAYCQHPMCPSSPVDQPDPEAARTHAHAAPPSPSYAGLPPPMEQDPPGIEPENESLELGTSVNPVTALRKQLERLQRMGLAVQAILDDVASVMERFGVS